MDPNDVVFYLSSDEEVSFNVDDANGGGGADDYDWIQKLLDEVDKDSDNGSKADKDSEADREDSDGSDDVVVVDEVVVNPRPKVKECNGAVDDDDDDDDCVVLDGDPDKAVAVGNSSPVEDESDELLVVRETGQVACRDYPHARHLCAKFPFSSTPHESYCNLCHCYVCDSLAPCLLWGTGFSSSDHCNATEKEDSWKHQRKSLKDGHQATVSVLEPATALTELPPISQVPVSTPLEPYHDVQGEIPRPASIRACTRATNFGVTNITNQNGSQQSGYVTTRNSLHPNLVSQQLQQFQTTDSNVISRDRRRSVGNLGPQQHSSSVVFKKVGLPGVASPPGPKYISSNGRYGYMRYPHLVSTLGGKNSMRWQNFHNQMGLHIPQLPSQPSMQINPSNFVAPQPLASFQPNMQRNILNSLPSQPQFSSQPNMTNIPMRPVPTHQPVMYPQQNIGNYFLNSVAAQYQVPSQAYVGGMSAQPQVQFQAYGGGMSTQPQVYSQPTIGNGNSFANTVQSESQAHGQPNYASNGCQTFFAQENQSPNFLDTSFTEVDSSWVTPTSQSSQQPTAEIPKLGDVDCKEEPSPLAGIDDLFGGRTGPVSLDFEYDWTLDHRDVPVHSPGPVLSDSGVFFGL